MVEGDLSTEGVVGKHQAPFQSEDPGVERTLTFQSLLGLCWQ